MSNSSINDMRYEVNNKVGSRKCFYWPEFN